VDAHVVGHLVRLDDLGLKGRQDVTRHRAARERVADFEPADGTHLGSVDKVAIGAEIFDEHDLPRRLTSLIDLLR
jgi:hypothetical protein